MGDLRSAIRVFRSTPMVSAVALLSLALGIGVNTSIFTLLNSLLLPKDASRRTGTPRDGDVGLRNQPWISQAGAGGTTRCGRSCRRGPTCLMARSRGSADRSRSGRARNRTSSTGCWSAVVSSKPSASPAQYGRVFTGTDDVRGGGLNGPVVVVSHAFWQRRLAGDAHAVGKPLIVEGVSFTIVGVTPREFLGLEVGQSFDVALPLASEPLMRGKDSALLQPGSYLLLVMLRLKRSQSLQSATTLVRSLEPEIVPGNAPRFVRPFALAPAAEGTSTPSGSAGGLRQRFRQPLFIIMAVVGFMLLIACLNIAHLSMTRAVARHREFAIRFALGASRWQVARQVFIENLTLATAGTALGILVAGWASRLLLANLANSVRQVVLDLSFDWHVAAFAVGITFATAMIFGLAPVLRASRPDVMDALKSDRRQTSGGGTNRFSASLVVTQIAVSLMLVVAAGLFVRTFAALVVRPLGFDSDRVLIVRVDSIRSHLSPDARSMLFDSLVDTASHVPGVERAAASAWTPLTDGGLFGVTIAGDPSDTERSVIANFITPGWFHTYGTPIIAGRDLDARDIASAPPVLLVNEAFVRHFLHGRSPLGAAVRLSARVDGPPPRTIVGVTHDAIFRSGRMVAGAASLALRDEIPPMIYVPIAQSAGMRPPGLTSLDISIRSTRAAPVALASAVGAAFARCRSKSLVDDQTARTTTWTPRWRRIVSSRCCPVSSVRSVCCSLVWASMESRSYSVHVRRAELGIRLALERSLPASCNSCSCASASSCRSESSPGVSRASG